MDFIKIKSMNIDKCIDVLEKAQKLDEHEQRAIMDEIDEAVKFLIESRPDIEVFDQLMSGIVLSAKGFWYLMNYNSCKKCVMTIS